MGDQLQVLQADYEETKRQVAEMRGMLGGTTALGAPGSLIDFTPPPPPPPSPTSDNQLKNGDESHSVGSFWEAVIAVNDEFREAFGWYTHNTPAAGQALDLTTDARTNSVNKTLKNSAHSTYDPAYCDWDSTRGVARLTGTKSLDAPLSGSPVGSGRTEYLGARIALRNSRIIVPPGGGIAAMLYDNTALDFMKAGNVFHLSGVRRGTVTGVTERRYKILAETDRGYSYLSDEYIDANAPDDSSFATADEYLTWDRISGVLKYKVYRHDITAGKYRLLHEVTSGANTFGDNGTIEAGHDNEGGYPAATHDRVICYVATLDGALDSLAVDGMNDWDDLWLNIPVPDPLASAASGNQVFRLALTVALDRRLLDVTSTAGSKTVGSATGAFTSLDTGRIATLYAADGVTVLHGPEALTFNDATHIDFATNVATNQAGVILYIVGGGDHGLLVDLLHLSYQDRAKFSFWPEDRNRTLQPTAAPTTTGQGGIGTGGDGGDPGDGGIGGCVTMDCPTWIYEGNLARAVPFSLLRRGIAMLSGGLAPNYTKDLLISETDNLHIVRFENGIEVPCSPKQPFFTSQVDQHGTAACRLKAGDRALTVRDGRLECPRILWILATGKPAKVGTPSLRPGHSYVAGFLRLSLLEQLWRWLWPKDRGASGAILHNAKNQE